MKTEIFRQKKGLSLVSVILAISILCIIFVIMIRVNPLLKNLVTQSDSDRCSMYLDLDNDDEKNIDDECPCDPYTAKEYYHLDINNKDISRDTREKCKDVPLVKKDELYVIEDDFETDCILPDGVSEELIEKQEDILVQYCITPKEDCDILVQKECKLKIAGLKINTDLS